MSRRLNRHSCSPRSATLHCGAEFCRVAGWGFHAGALTSPGVDLPAVLANPLDISFMIRTNPSGNLHGRD
jgi:hypothetical protein